MTKAELNAKFPLTAPECPFCKQTTVRRRRFWERWTRVFCKTPGCGGVGELMPRGFAGPGELWSWMKTR